MDHFVNDVESTDPVISDLLIHSSFNPTPGKAQIRKEGCLFSKWMKKKNMAAKYILWVFKILFINKRWRFISANKNLPIYCKDFILKAN